jgi:hypothetical protein
MQSPYRACLLPGLTLPRRRKEGREMHGSGPASDNIGLAIALGILAVVFWRALLRIVLAVVAIVVMAGVVMLIGHL